MSTSRKSNPDFYAKFLAERESILEHKWYLSEQLGRDVGFERALADWIAKHRARWLEESAERKAPPQ